VAGARGRMTAGAVGATVDRGGWFGSRFGNGSVAGVWKLARGGGGWMSGER